MILKADPPKPAAACPFVIIRDTREQAPYTFDRITTGSDRKPVLVTVEDEGLASGDYSIRGHEERITIERKSLGDLFGTLTVGRDRFERELERMTELPHSFVVVEGSWSQMGERPPFASKVNPASIVGTIMAFQQRFPRTHWLPCGNRSLAEWTTYQVLRRYWIDNVETPAKDERRKQKQRSSKEVTA